MSPPHDPWTWQCRRAVPSDPQAVKPVLEELLQAMEAQRWSRRDVFCVHLAVHEALSNAILHGNQKDPRKHVHFDGKVSAGWVRVEIADEGSGFDPDALPDPTAPAHRQRCEGRGVMLMQALMSRVAFHDQGRQVVLEKDRS